MIFPNPFLHPPFALFFESLLPDFILAFTFFTALVYAVLAKRFDHQRSAVAMSAAVGLALAVGLVWWEYQRGWSIRNLGPVAIGFVVILLAMIMFQGIRQTGGSWSGAGIAFGASILVAWVLGVDWPIAPQVIQSLAIVALIVGIVAFVLHGHGPARHVHFAPAGHEPQLCSASARPEVDEIRHDMHDLYDDRRAGDRLREVLDGLRQRSTTLPEHPQDATAVMSRIRQILPAEGWLTERLARLRERAHHFRKGHLTRIDELKRLVRKLPDAPRKRALKELDARYEELKIDKRLERLDAAVAENERRIRQLTLDAQAALAHYDYRKLAELLEVAEKLQAHNNELFRAIDRTEQKLAAIVGELVKEFSEGTGK